MMLFPATTAVLILATLLTTPAASKEAIEVEAAFDDKRVPARHSDYLSGNHELTSNEAEFFFPRLVEDSKASGGTIEFDALERETGGRAEELAS